MSRPTSASALALFATALALCTCEGRNLGRSAVDVGLYFPAAMTLDPRVPADEPARWLFVANANSDLTYNAGSLVAVDLDKFFRSWMNCADLCIFGVDDGTCTGADRMDPCGVNKGVHDVGEDVTEDEPCRHVALRPQVIECEDTFMLSDTAVRMGSFITSLVGWTKDAATNTAYLLASVKADPSITWVELTGDPKGEFSLDCGQPDPDLADPGRCSRKTHALRYPYDDSDSFPRIGPEPTKIVISKVASWAYVTFATTPQVVLIDLAGKALPGLDANESAVIEATTGGSSGGDTSGTSGGTGEGGSSGGGSSGGVTPEPVDPNTRPMIVDQRVMFLAGDSVSGGGWGLAERPCVPGSDQVPALTRASSGPDGDPVDCARPLVYGGFRTALILARMFPDEVSPLTRDYSAAIAALEDRRAAAELAGEDDEARSLEAEIERLKTLTQRCIGDDTPSGSSGGIVCDPQMFFAGFTRAGGFDTAAGVSGTAIMGDIQFSRDGRRLYAVQSNPGSLMYIDTSVNERGELKEQPAGVVELCNGPTTMRIFEDGSNEYAAVTCPGPSELFIVDLSGFRVVANVVTGAGPHAIVVDEARRLLYVGNTLERTISVIDVARDRATRFAEIARVGLQEPYKR